MSDMRATAIGTCGACDRLIYQMTPVGNVERGGRRFMAHKDCADKEKSVEPMAEPIVVTPPEEALAGFVKLQDELVDKEVAPKPSMPVKEQQPGRRRTKKVDEKVDEDE